MKKCAISVILICISTLLLSCMSSKKEWVRKAPKYTSSYNFSQDKFTNTKLCSYVKTRKDEPVEGANDSISFNFIVKINMGSKQVSSILIDYYESDFYEYGSFGMAMAAKSASLGDYREKTQEKLYFLMGKIREVYPVAATNVKDMVPYGRIVSISLKNTYLMDLGTFNKIVDEIIEQKTKGQPLDNIQLRVGEKGRLITTIDPEKFSKFITSCVIER